MFVSPCGFPLAIYVAFTSVSGVSMAMYRLHCTKSKIAAVSMGHWTVRIIYLVSTLLVGIIIGLYRAVPAAGLDKSVANTIISFCLAQSMQVLSNYVIICFMKYGK
jgi:hypothetical protein